MQAFNEHWKTLVVWNVAVPCVVALIALCLAGVNAAAAIVSGAVVFCACAFVSTLSAIAALLPRRGLSFLGCLLAVGLTLLVSFVLSLNWAAVPIDPTFSPMLCIWAPLLASSILFAYGLRRSYSSPMSELEKIGIIVAWIIGHSWLLLFHFNGF